MGIYPVQASLLLKHDLHRLTYILISKMSVGSWAATVAWWVALWVAVLGQRAPCYQCELYRDAHPHSRPYNAIRARCVYPCECSVVPECAVGVPLVRDGCGCCWQCARQMGEICNSTHTCDTSRNLTCVYTNAKDLSGVCREMTATATTMVGCHVINRTFENGENFSPDCRTQCSCQNGTYACVSLCPNESLQPSSQCHNPHLVTVPGQCCREWMCDTTSKAEGPPPCERASGRWSPCSVTTCGIGLSVRWSTDNSRCQLVNQTRLCQLRPCQDLRQQQQQQQQGQQQQQLMSPNNQRATRKHHIRRGHQCKATLRPSRALRLRVGWCVSERRYRPKRCATCPGRCCTVHTSTTISITFLCPLHANTDLLALPRAFPDPHPLRLRPRAPHTPPTTTLSVYDMMDEGQPVAEAVLTDPRLPRDYNEVWSGTEDDPDNEPLLEHENLTTEDDYLYDEIKSDNYETVQYQVEWIMRCKCGATCETELLSPPPPPPTLHTAPPP